ncbi:MULTISPECIES: hypothetical protein [unclassified Methanoregula]|nr:MULTISPECIES: hypothetical protein [unclassified Methanoregula]
MKLEAADKWQEIPEISHFQDHGYVSSPKCIALIPEDAFHRGLNLGA